MMIYKINIMGVEHKLKYPIEIDERESWMGGKRMYVLESKDFGLLSYHNNLNVSRDVMTESVNLLINSHIHEDYSDPECKRALKFQNMMKRYIYG